MTDNTLLDGGMGQEQVARSGDEPTPLWATRVMLDHPGLVRDIHADYFAAGATIATTNTYAIHHFDGPASSIHVASPKNVRYPKTSVKVVTNVPEASAGSSPNRCSPKGTRTPPSAATI